MRTISVKLFWFWTSGSGDFIQRYFLSRALLTPLRRGKPFVQFLGIIRNISVKLLKIWNSGSEKDVI